MDKKALSLIKKVYTVFSRKDEKILYKNKIEALIQRGLVIGKNVTIEDSVYIDEGYPYLIKIGDNCSLAAFVRLLAHDDTFYKFNGGYARLGKIEIGNNCFIGESAVILPGVTIGSNVMIAAGSLVNKDIPSNLCIAGVPARFYAKFNETLEKNMEDIKTRPIFNYSELRSKKDLDHIIKNKVKEAVKDGVAFVKGKDKSQFAYLTWNR
jgi:maltose O-acetyltransferase